MSTHVTSFFGKRLDFLSTPEEGLWHVLATRSGFGLPINHSPHLAICDFYLATCFHMLAETWTVVTSESARPLFVICSISTGISIVLFANKLVLLPCLSLCHFFASMLSFSWPQYSVQGHVYNHYEINTF